MLDLSKFVSSLGGKAVYVYGLGKSGRVSAQALSAAGARVYVWDDLAAQRDQMVASDAGANERIIFRPDSEVNFADLGCVLLSPGIPLTHPSPHPVVEKARAHHIEVIGDIEVLGRCLHVSSVKTVGITGTNGKSTTTALVGHILNTCGMTALVGGNIGVPVLGFDLHTDVQVIVLELSSYQVDLCPNFHPDIGVLLNVTPDHLDRHGSLEHYAAVKARMFGHHTRPIISCDDPLSKEIFDVAAELGKAPIALTLSAPLPFDPSELKTLAGVHNHQNALAAWHVCKQLGLAEPDIFNAMKTFPGLAHRQQIIRKIKDVTFINDSKATNAEAAGKALASYESIYWIIGGQSKAGGLSGLEDYRSRIKKAYVIGAATEEFSGWLAQNAVPFEACQILEKAVSHAVKDALQSGTEGVVLLSPACASWDQFKNFEHRGEVFTKLVGDLPISG
ncbi:MAG: UDP-N-acetylmuramoyl-L-alanine--D-glutamate ligase [Rhodospirillales bacterium]|nr:UDP-N-acetylmuramoyl-L-alanine--D-glutamate ligase [Rhodospirillales bacterium]